MKTNICKCGGKKRVGYAQCRKCYLDYYTNRTTKLCKKCGNDLPLDAFRKRPDGLRPRSRCRQCEAEYAKEFRKTNPEKVKERKRMYAIRHPDRVRRGKMRRGWRKMGLDPDDIEIRLSNHKGGCQICGNPPPDYYQNLSVDHCHITEKFRGFLCPQCNSGLGYFRDKPELLMKAAEYLNTFRAQATVQ